MERIQLLPINTSESDLTLNNICQSKITHSAMQAWKPIMLPAEMDEELNCSSRGLAKGFIL